MNIIEGYLIVKGALMKKFIFFLVVLGVVGACGVGAYAALKPTGSVNVLVYGLEGTRSDSMMLVMIDQSTKQTHVITLPRDTYHPVEGHNAQGAKKLNAVYGFKKGGKTAGLEAAVEDITGVKIDYYVEIKYEGVKSVVDLLGGIPVEVPFDMAYDDPFATPPLHIDLKAGEQVLEGEDVIGYLRFRKSNDGKIREGDIDRIARQQAFLKSAVGEAISWKLPLLANQALKYVETDMNSAEILQLCIGMAGAQKEDVYFHVLPKKKIGTGKDGLSYYFHSEAGMEQLLEDIEDNVFETEREAAELSEPE